MNWNLISSSEVFIWPFHLIPIRTLDEVQSVSREFLTMLLCLYMGLLHIFLKISRSIYRKLYLSSLLLTVPNFFSKQLPYYLCHFSTFSCCLNKYMLSVVLLPHFKLIHLFKASKVDSTLDEHLLSTLREQMYESGWLKTITTANNI